MQCPKCEKETDVLDSRRMDGTVRRRRKCKSCQHRFSTEERLFEAPQKRKTAAPQTKRPKKRKLTPRPRKPEISFDEIDHMTDEELEAMITGDNYD